MAELFDPTARNVRVPVVVVGPRQSHDLWCVIDTGSTRPVLPASFLRLLGYDLSRPVSQTRIRGATGIARAPLVRVSAIAALGRVRTGFLVAAHDFPIGTQADGLPGLDFFRGMILRLDFSRGRAALYPRRWWRFWR